MRKRLGLKDWRSWVGFGIWLAFMAACLIGGALASQNPFTRPAYDEQVNFIVTTFSIDRKTEIDQADLDYLRLFFSNSVLAQLWNVCQMGGGKIDDWGDILDNTEIKKSDLRRLSVFYSLSGSIPEK